MPGTYWGAKWVFDGFFFFNEFLLSLVRGGREEIKSQTAVSVTSPPPLSAQRPQDRFPQGQRTIPGLVGRKFSR
jgi:hypothetical protein